MDNDPGNPVRPLLNDVDPGRQAVPVKVNIVGTQEPPYKKSYKTKIIVIFIDWKYIKCHSSPTDINTKHLILVPITTYRL